MREFLLITILLTTFLFPQSKLNWFFSDIENKELLSVEIKEQINPELEMMVSNYNKLFKDNLIKKETSFVSGTSFDRDGYTNALLSMRNPTANDDAYLRRGFTRKYYSSKFIPRTININKVIKKQTPEWGEIVKYYGGYSQLAEKGIDKSKINDFELTTTLESIQFTKDGNSTDVLVKISGGAQALSYYNITEKELKSKGNYKIPTITYVDINRLSRDNNDGPKVEFTFTDESLEKENLSLELVFGSDVKILVDEAVKINKVISLMVDDLVSSEFYNNMEHVKIANIERQKRFNSGEALTLDDIIYLLSKELPEIIGGCTEEAFQIWEANTTWAEDRSWDSWQYRMQNKLVDVGYTNDKRPNRLTYFRLVEENGDCNKPSGKTTTITSDGVLLETQLMSDNDLRSELLTFFKENSQKSSNAPGWDEYRKDKDRKAAGISADRMKKINDNLKKDNWEYIIEANIYRTKAGQALWMGLGFPYITKDGSFSQTELRAYLGNFVHALKTKTVSSKDVLLETQLISDNDLKSELITFFKENSQKSSSNAPGWDEYRKNEDRKAAGISADRMKKINDNLKKNNWKYIIEANIYRTKAGQALWMELGFPYITKDGSFSQTELRAYLGNFVHAFK